MPTEAVHVESTRDIIWYNYIDLRIKDLPIISSAYQVPIIVITYLALIYVIIPKYMKNKKPYNLKTFTRIYNVAQIIANGYITHETISLLRSGDVTIYCETGSASFEPGPYKTAIMIYITALVKLIDLVETIVFLLRKKNNQVSFLHVYHHVTVVVLTWLLARHAARGMVLVALSVNTLVHVIMYTYYLLSTYPKMKFISDRIKRYITTIQLTQFVILLAHVSQGLNPSCGIPVSLVTTGIIEVITNLLLFVHFYRKTYGNKKKIA